MSQENVEIVRAVYDEWGKGNFRAGVDLYDRHVVLVTVADYAEGGRFLGPDGIRKFMRRWLEPWRNLTIAAEDVIPAGDSVVVAARQRGVGQESGAPAEDRYFHVWTFRGRAVTRLEFFRDRAEALAAVGLSE